MMADSVAGVEDIDKDALCAKTSTLAEAGILWEDEIGEVKLTLMPAAILAEESIGKAIKIATRKNL